jgi:hypothetical protein
MSLCFPTPKGGIAVRETELLNSTSRLPETVKHRGLARQSKTGLLVFPVNVSVAEPTSRYISPFISARGRPCLISDGIEHIVPRIQYTCIFQAIFSPENTQCVAIYIEVKWQRGVASAASRN